MTPDTSLTPGPDGLKLLRSIPAIQRDPLRYLLHSAQTYGNVVRFPINQWSAFLVNHPDGVRHILQDNSRNYDKNTLQYNQLATVTGRGLLTSDGEVWLRQRRLMQPAFHRQRLAKFDALIVQATEGMLKRWQARPNPQAAIDIDHEMLSLTLEIVGKALFGIDLRAEAGELTSAVLTALDHIVYKAQNFAALPESIPTPRNRRFKTALHTLDSAVQTLIRARQAHPNPPDDLLTMLLHARDEQGNGMSAAQLRDEILTLLIAGHETVASALTWTWYLLSTHPMVRAQLEEELARVLQSRLPTSADLELLPYTRQIFEEALRLYPPAWLITRRARADDVVLGYRIPANSLMIISPYVLHRHPQFWQNPEGFDLTRFAPGVERTRFAYIPFGGGARLCIGDRMAQLEAVLILATVSQRVRLNRVAGHPIEVLPLVTLRPRYGMPMNLAFV